MCNAVLQTKKRGETARPTLACGAVRQTHLRISAQPTFSSLDPLQNLAMKRSIAVMAIGLLSIAAANAQQAKPAHGDHCRDSPNTASSGKTDCGRLPARDSSRGSDSNASSRSSTRPDDSSTRSTAKARSAAAATSNTPRSTKPGDSDAPPSTPPAPPPGPNPASAAGAQTTPAPVQHEPPVSGSGSKSNGAQPAPR